MTTASSSARRVPVTGPCGRPARLGASGAAHRRVVFDERPVYSPDGREIAFVSDRGGRRGIWIVSREGGTPRLIAYADVSTR